MTTIYEEARNRLEGEIRTLELRLDMSKGSATVNMLSSQLKSYETELKRLENDFYNTDPTSACHQESLKQTYVEGDDFSESLILYYAFQTHA